MLLLASLWVMPAVAQNYPSKPIRLIVPSAPGGGTDLIARMVAQRVSEAWGQPIVVDNIGGGATTIGTNLVAKAAPDGYTLLMTSANFAFVPAIHSKLVIPMDGDYLCMWYACTYLS